MYILKGENRKFTKICYDMMLNDMVLFPNKNNWVIRVRNLLNNTGFSIVWHEIAFLTLLQQRLGLAFSIRPFFESITIS